MLEPAAWPQMKPTSSPSGNSLYLIDMVDMAVREPDLFNRDPGLFDRGFDPRHVAAGVDHDGLLGRLVPEDGAVLLEQRHGNDDRAGFGLGLGLLGHTGQSIDWGMWRSSRPRSRHGRAVLIFLAAAPPISEPYLWFGVASRNRIWNAVG